MCVCVCVQRTHTCASKQVKTLNPESPLRHLYVGVYLILCYIHLLNISFSFINPLMPEFISNYIKNIFFVFFAVMQMLN